MTTLQDVFSAFSNKLRHRRTWLLLFASILFANLGGRMIEVFLPVHLENLGASRPQIGLFFSLLSGVLLLTAVFGGMLADVAGHIQSVLVASVAGLGAFVFLRYAGSWPGVLAGVAVLYGTSKIVGPAIYAYVAGQVSPEEFARNFGRLRRLIISAGVIAPVLGGALVAAEGIQGMLAYAAAIYGLAVLARLFLPAASRGIRGEARRADTDGLVGILSAAQSLWACLAAGGVFLYLFIVDGLGDIATAFSVHFFPIFLAGRQVSMIALGWIGGAFLLFEFFAISLSVKISETKGEKWAMIAGFLLQAAALAGFVQANSFLGFLFAWGLVGAGQGLVTPAANALVARSVPENVRATSFGLIAAGAGLFSLLVPFAAGHLYQAVSPSAPFILGLLFALAAVPLLYRKIPSFSN